MGTTEIFSFHKHSIFRRYLIGFCVVVGVLLINVVVKYFFSDFVPMTLFLGPVVIGRVPQLVEIGERISRQDFCFHKVMQPTGQAPTA